MTAGQFREVDLGLLADYLGGALDGTPQEQLVATLVSEDPGWAEAHATLSPAIEAVRGDLADWGRDPLALPSTVADRITAALAALPPPTGPADAPPALVGHQPGHSDRPAVSAGTRSASTAPEPPRPQGADQAGADQAGADQAGADQAGADPGPAGALPDPLVRGSVGGTSRPQGRGTGTTGPSAARPGGGTGPGRSRGRRWARVAAPVALALTALAALGLGIDHWGLGGGARDGAGGTALQDATGAPEAAGPMAAPVPTSVPFLLVAEPGRNSGTDHTARELAARGAQPRGGAPQDTGSDETYQQQEQPVPGELNRLVPQGALNDCLTGVAGEHGSAPITVEILDYATFEGRPALVLEFVDPTGARWAWASGPACGLPDSGADTRYRSQVG